MLGARRTTVTAAAGELQRRGLIQYSRGRIHLSDPEGLRGVACECYSTVRELYGRFYCHNDDEEPLRDARTGIA